MNVSSETWQEGDQSLQVTHLEKVYRLQLGFTKGDMFLYYWQIAPVVLPHLKDRPVTLHVYPQGVEAASHYLRDCPEQVPAWLRTVQYQPKTVSHLVPLPLIDTRLASYKGDLVTIDYAQNSVGRNTATPYILRARQAYPAVSTPLTWAELDEGSIDLARFLPQEVLERARRLGDQFAPAL